MEKGKKVKELKWELELECKPDFKKCMERIYAWYEGQVIDRAPVRFSAHNSYMNEKDETVYKWKNLEEKWFDCEYQIDRYIQSIEKKPFLGETFPVYFPNLGPNVFASFYGSRLQFGEETSWAQPVINEWSEINNLKLDMQCVYMKKIEEMTKYALERCDGRFMVGYTDLHPGLDCVAAWRDTQSLLFDFYDEPGYVKSAVDLAYKDFQMIYDHFDAILKSKGQLSVTWMGIPSFGKMHIPSCDFSSMISPDQFIEFCLPKLKEEVLPMTHNIFHLDGKDVARHLDVILEVPEIQAIQWVQGLGKDAPIMQWIPLIKKIRSAGKSVVVDLLPSELEEFISAISPEGLLLCLPSDDREEQEAILKRVERWQK